jgi:protein-tyrosine phosphatase
MVEDRSDVLRVGAGQVVLSALPASHAARAGLEKFHPDLVLSLTESHEMQDAGAADLGTWLAARGIGWCHHPVPDFATPGDGGGVGADWASTEARLRAVLAGGGRLWLHCRAGLGRSGAVALRLMVASGEAPGPALERLRAARPGAVETEAQRLWAANGAGD